MAYPTGPHPFPPTLVMALGSLLLLERRPALAGALAGLAAVWRIEFAAYLCLGALLAYALRPGERLRPALQFGGAALLVAAALYIPVVAAAGLGDSFDLLVRYPLEDFSDYQSLPFPLDYDGPLNTGSIGGFLSDSAESLLLFYLPLVLVLGLVASLAALAFRFERERWWQLAAAVFAVGMAHYLLTRPDAFHTAPLAVMVAVLAAWALADAREVAGAAAAARARRHRPRGVRGRVRGRRGRSTGAGSSCAPTMSRFTSRPRTACACAPAAATPLERAVHAVQARVPPGRPIYVATRRSDLVTSGDPLFYVLADRRNPTRYDIQAPGVITSAPVQREIVRDLERARPRVVVRFTSPVTAVREPNRAGESTGVTILDDYLARAYRRAARFGPYVILGRTPAASRRSSRSSAR